MLTFILRFHFEFYFSVFSGFLPECFLFLASWISTILLRSFSISIFLSLASRLPAHVVFFSRKRVFLPLCSSHVIQSIFTNFLQFFHDSVGFFDALRATQAKARQEVEIGQAQNEVQNKCLRVAVDAGESSEKSGDQKSPFNLNDAIITSAMNSGLSNLNDRSILGEGSEVKILETQDSMGPPKTTKVGSEGVLPGIQSSI